MYRVLWAYLKQQYSSLTAYKSAFCMTLVNVFIRIYAYAMLWMTLYKQNASLFGNIDLNQMLLYSIFSISLSQAFTWWDGPHIYVEENIKNGRIDFTSPSFTDDEHFAQRIKRAVPKAGDIVITREAPMGEVGMILEGIKCCLGQRMVLLRANERICDKHYLLYGLQSQFVQHQISWSEGTGTTVSNLRIPHLEQIRVPYVPLDQQKKISSVLYALGDKIENNRKLNDNLAA